MRPEAVAVAKALLEGRVNEKRGVIRREAQTDGRVKRGEIWSSMQVSDSGVGRACRVLSEVLGFYGFAFAPSFALA